MSRHPEVLWAQRTDKLFLTIELPDAKQPKVKVDADGKFSFSATGVDDKQYEVELQLNGAIDEEASKISTGNRNIFCVLAKKEMGYWPRLLKAAGKTPPNVKVDWNKWVDEDEEADAQKLDNFDLGSMANMSNFDLGGGGGEGEDSDDDELPELEK